MIIFNSTFYIVFQCFVIIFHWIKFNVYRLISPIVENIIQHRLKKWGVALNGNNSWDLQILHKDAYARIGTYYNLGLAEAYMDKSIHIEDLVEFFLRILKNENYKGFASFNFQQYFNLQTKSLAWEVGKSHYDLGNELFEAMLDPWMQYTCGYWKDATNLEEAQIAKMDLIARKLMLKPGMRVLDIGCGFGSLAKYLAVNYGVHVVGVTISAEQVKYAKERFAHPNVDIRLQDYRDVDEVFDRVVSVGCIEHVGYANYDLFFRIARRCLKDNGIFLLHGIGINDKDFPNTDNFSHKYIFPNAMMPRQNILMNHIHGLFYIEDWHNFGYDYSKTLKAWDSNFVKAWPKLEYSYDQKFYRMWTYYLRGSTAMFMSRKANLWQLVLTKSGLKGGYTSVR